VRAASEVVSLLVLLAAVTASFVAILVLVPRYFATYNRVAVEASQSQLLEGYQTTASLSRYKGGQYLSLMIYNAGDKMIKVNYYVECVDPKSASQRYFVGKEEGIFISPGYTYQKVYSVSSTNINNKVCYLVVEEPNLLIYKVLES